MGYIQQSGSGGFYGKGDLSDFASVDITVFELAKQNTDTRSPHHIVKGAQIDTFKFYCPNEVFENISHTWEEYDSMPGRLSQAITSAKKEVTEVKGIAGQAGQGNAGIGTTDSSKYKLDTPLVWNGSQRRELSMPIIMMEQNASAAAKMFQVSKDFKSYSSAKILGPGTTAAIHLPYIFRVEVGSMVSIENAACTAVQSIFHYPFIGGYPSRIEMTLTFVDLLPLYDYSFTQKATVTTSFDDRGV